MSSMMKIKILYRKNLKMSPGKLAAQAVHAVLGFVTLNEVVDPVCSVIVLGVSNKKFDEARSYLKASCHVVKDAGYTEVEPGTETCLAYLEEDE